MLVEGKQQVYLETILFDCSSENMQYCFHLILRDSLLGLPPRGSDACCW